MPYDVRLLHAFLARAGAGDILAAATAAEEDAGRFAGRRAAVGGQYRVRARRGGTRAVQAPDGGGGGTAGRPGVAAGVPTLRPRLAAIADRTDPLELQALFAKAMLAADPVASGGYYVDDHFIPYTGAKLAARAGTTSGERPGGDTPAPTSPRTTGLPCASSPASRPG